VLIQDSCSPRFTARSSNNTQQLYLCLAILGHVFWGGAYDFVRVRVELLSKSSERGQMEQMEKQGLYSLLNQDPKQK
jgi:hypothetical protein